MNALGKVRIFLLGFLLLTAAGLRLHHPMSDPWYSDEGNVAELVGSMGQGTHVGAIKQNWLMPLSTGWPAPASAWLFAKLLPLPVLGSLRVWAGLCGVASVALLFLLGWRMRAEGLAWGASGAYAFALLIINLDRMAFYHHFGSVLGIAAILLGIEFLRNGQKKSFAWFSSICGLAIASAYWMFPLGLVPLLAAWQKKRLNYLVWGIPLLAVPMLSGLVMGWMVDPASFVIDFKDLWSQTSVQGAPEILGSKTLWSFYHTGMKYPLLFTGLLGLCLAAFTWKRNEDPVMPGRWILLFSLAISIETFRQRQNLTAFPYPLIQVMPVAAIGIGLLGQQALELWQVRVVRIPRNTSRILAVLIVAGSAWSLSFKPDFDFFHRLGAPPEPAGELLAFLKTETSPGDFILGEITYNWALPRDRMGCDLDHSAAALGYETPFIPRGWPKSRFVFDPDPKNARVMVMSAHHRGFTLHHAGARKLALAAEAQGWPLIFNNQHYQVYGNPAFGYIRDMDSSYILLASNHYDQAAIEASAEKDWKSCYFALQRGLVFKENIEWRRQQMKALVEAGYVKP